MTKMDGGAHSPITILNPSGKQAVSFCLFVCLYGRLVFDMVSHVA